MPIRLATSMKHHSVIREPYQAHASHKAARVGSSYALGRVSIFVSVRRFGEDSTDRCLGVVRFFSENSVEWVRCSSCMHTLWCPWCRLAMPRLMASVSRMGLCGSLFVVRHSLCQLSSFFNAELFFFFFFGPCLFERLVTNFSFEPSLQKFKFESTSFFCFLKKDFLYPFFYVLKRVPAFVWVSARVSGCAGVWVCGDWHAFARQESCKHASRSRRFKSAARRQTPRIH